MYILEHACSTRYIIRTTTCTLVTHYVLGFYIFREYMDEDWDNNRQNPLNWCHHAKVSEVLKYCLENLLLFFLWLLMASWTFISLKCISFLILTLHHNTAQTINCALQTGNQCICPATSQIATCSIKLMICISM